MQEKRNGILYRKPLRYFWRLAPAAFFGGLNFLVWYYLVVPYSLAHPTHAAEWCKELLAQHPDNFVACDVGLGLGPFIMLLVILGLMLLFLSFWWFLYAGWDSKAVLRRLISSRRS